MKHEIITPSEKDRLFADLDKPSLEALAYKLRHPETWPRGFIWSYLNCDQCAMGLAHYLWEDEVDEHPDISTMARTFAMPYTIAQKIFQDANMSRFEMVSIVTRKKRWLGIGVVEERQDVAQSIDMQAVTPEMVADDIDAYLAQRPA